MNYGPKVWQKKKQIWNKNKLTEGNSQSISKSIRRDLDNAKKHFQSQFLNPDSIGGDLSYEQTHKLKMRQLFTCKLTLTSKVTVNEPQKK